MTSSRYHGFTIVARPYQLHESGRWAAHLEIRRNGRAQPISAGGRYETEQEANGRAAELCRRIIDGGVPGWSVDHLRRRSRGWQAFLQDLRDTVRRAQPFAGLLPLGLGRRLLRGATAASGSTALQESDAQATVAGPRTPST